jgi:hypothetical protein
MQSNARDLRRRARALCQNATFVTFDVTDAKTTAVAAARADKLGLTKLFDADKTPTSTVAVINPKTGVVALLYGLAIH